MSQTATDRRERSNITAALLRIASRLNASVEIDGLLDGFVAEAIKLTNSEGGFGQLFSPGNSPRSEHPAGSSISASLVDTNGEEIGFIEVHNRRDGAPFAEEDKQALAAVAQITSAAIQNAFQYARLRELSAELLRLQDVERRRVSRELHDSTGQYLDMLIADLKTLTRSTGLSKSETQRLLLDSLSMAEECSRQIRTISYLLHPPLLDELGLESALRWYVDGFVRRSGIRVSVEFDERCGTLGTETDIVVFRVVQEALTNVHRHSGSASASIRLAAKDGNCELEIEDHGKGMSRERPPLGTGIMGMQERVRQVRGTLKIDSGAGGTTVRVNLPVDERPAG